MNALPEMIITVSYENGHGSNSNFSINMTVSLCDSGFGGLGVACCL